MSDHGYKDPSGTTAVPPDPFHEHLDACEQCREQPFSLCETGTKALDVSMKKLDEAITKMVPPRYVQRRPRWP